MARMLSTPLTQEDVAHLKSRYPLSYVDRMIELNGQADASAKAEEAPDAPESPDAQVQVEAQAEVENGPENPEEDLIGGLFDPKDHTEGEIRDHLAEFPDDRERVLALEREGRQRKGVLAL